MMAEVEAIRRLDARLLAVPVWLRAAVLVVTVAAMVYQALPLLPRHGAYGPDTISDMYESKVVLHDDRDMYTRSEVNQTPLEAATWSKEAVAPYPPVVLLAEAGLYAIGARTGLGFYGMILLLAIVFIGLSLLYFARTRWYLFPILYLNFAYVGNRFVAVQDDTYLVMLVVIIAALFLARARRQAAHILMAVAITMKFSPLYYAKNVLTMRRGIAVLFVAILVAGLIAPYFIWNNYLYIYRFNEELKGTASSRWMSAIIATGFSAMLWRLEDLAQFDMEDRVGWGLVPFAMYLAIRMNVARHLLLMLLVPDKRAVRNLIAAIGLTLHSLFPAVVLQGSMLSIMVGLLVVYVAGQLVFGRHAPARV